MVEEETDLAYQDRFIEDEQQRENEDDVGQLDINKVGQAVIFYNDWTTETIINQIKKGNILLNPTFQRRDAWTSKRKSKFIESLILGFPIPQLVFAEQAKGKYIVLDGKQRLLSIFQFAAGGDTKGFENLKLTGLDLRPDLNKKSLSDLKTGFDLFNDVSAFENSTLRTVIVRNWPNEAFLYHVFLRLNTETATLSPQELRLALNPGPFTNFIEEESKNSAALRDILNSDKPDFRMRDAELLLRYYAFTYFLPTYKGNLKDFLDTTCKKLNKEWRALEGDIREKLDEFEKTHDFIRKVFRNDAYQKYKEGVYENRFNRAVYDIMMFVFGSGKIRDKISDPNDIKTIFENLCTNERKFLDAIEHTTKSIDAVKTRMHKWIDAINKKYNLKIKKPLIEKKR